ncbi:endonuclease, partial [Klebsiella pneumoniae]|nr:endonuclease [Klebsiella pneumoniae]
VKTVAKTELQPECQISLIVSNVLTPNTQYHLLLQQIRQHQPDLILTLESDAHWEQALSVLEDDYPYRVAVPLDNLY